MKSRPDILFLSSFITPFIQDDLETLERHFSVRTCVGHGLVHAIKAMASVFQSDLVFCWFGSVYAALAVFTAQITGSKTVIILAGVDVSKEPEYGYGAWLVPWKAVLLRYAFRRADHILVVAPSLRDDAIRLAGYPGDNIQYLPMGHDSDFWKPASLKAPVVLTVAVANDRPNVIRKGLDTLIETARLMPTVQFTVVGTDARQVENFNPPANIRFLAKVPREQLLPHYQRAKVYCQPSRREGLPNTLCEAMLCGCIPVGADSSGIPVAIGPEGILVPPGDPVALSEGITTALLADAELGLKARSRIISLFPKEKRERELVRLLRQLSVEAHTDGNRP